MQNLGSIFNGQVVKFHFTANNKDGGKSDFSSALETNDIKIMVNGVDTADPSAVVAVATGLFRVEWVATGLKRGDIVEFILDPDETLDTESVVAVIASGEGASSGFGEKVYYNEGGAESGSAYPVGSTPELASNTINNALSLAKTAKAELSFRGQYGLTAVAPTESFDGGIIRGSKSQRDFISFASMTSYDQIMIEGLKVASMNGSEQGKSAVDCLFVDKLRAYNGEIYKRCILDDVDLYNDSNQESAGFITAIFQDSEFRISTVDLSNLAIHNRVAILNCHGQVDFSGNNGGGDNFTIYAYGFKGKISLSNFKDGDSIYIYGFVGELGIYSSCTSGAVYVSGVGKVNDASGGGFTVNRDDFVDRTDVDTLIADTTTIKGQNVSIEADTNAIKTETDKFNFGVANALDVNIKAIDDTASKATALSNAINTTNDTVDADVERLKGSVIAGASGVIYAKNEDGDKIATETAVGACLTRANYIDFFNRDVTGRTASGNPSQYKIGTSSNQEIIDVAYNTIDGREKVDTETKQ